MHGAPYVGRRWPAGTMVSLDLLDRQATSRQTKRARPSFSRPKQENPTKIQHARNEGFFFRLSKTISISPTPC